MDLTFAAGIGALLLSLAHYYADKLKLAYIPRSKLLSFGGGISVSYVFTHVLPELNELQELTKRTNLFEEFQLLKHHAYLIALLGLTFFYGLERAAKLSYQPEKNITSEKTQQNVKVFWVHIFAFCLYNLLIGYLLLHRKQNDVQDLILFTTAIAFHFMVVDYGLVSDYKQDYIKKGRWMLTGSVIIGYLIGVLTALPEIYPGLIFAFIAGGIIMNTLKEELPEDRKSTFWAFLLGVILYSALLLNLE